MKTSERNEEIYYQFLELTNEGMKYTEAVRKLSEQLYGDGYNRAYITESAIRKIISDQKKVKKEQQDGR